jgi:hypothetical protein
VNEIKLYKSPWKAIKLILLCSIFVVGGYLILTSDDSPKWIGWFNIFFFGLGYPVGLFHLLDRRPQIIISTVGIFDRTTYDKFINWEVIWGAYAIKISGEKFICLEVDPNYEPSRKKGKLARTMSTLNKEIGAQELNISLGQVSVDQQKLLGFILTMVQLKPEERPGAIKLRRLR